MSQPTLPDRPQEPNREAVGLRAPEAPFRVGVERGIRLARQPDVERQSLATP
jgi:hypothetical protein